MPIKFTSALGEGYIYTTYVNGEETDIFAPEHGGKYLIKVITENPECDDCYIKENEIVVDVGYFPRVNKTRIVITSPQIGAEYYVNDSVPIEYKTPLTDRDGFEFTTYVTSPDGVCEPADIWTPTVPGEYGMKSKCCWRRIHIQHFARVRCFSSGIGIIDVDISVDRKEIGKEAAQIQDMMEDFFSILLHGARKRSRIPQPSTQG